ncbi:MAG: hypothetical protein AB7Q42_23110 [Acidimicrobiia bacterium]
MITTTHQEDGLVLITFSVDDDRATSVVGSFNDWDPAEHPLVEEIDGRQYATVAVPAGSTVYFRYLAEGGAFYDDPAADRIDPNGYGQTQSVLDEQLVPPEQATALTARRVRDSKTVLEHHAPVPA